ncbi:MAG TPA: tetratricopeptide repeat protein [Polyangia bacterium]|nr:tetratricopeptide repeat protein [Polyangia bacterium]
MLAAAPGAARADADQAAIDKVTKLNKKAVDEYENLNFDQARKILTDALDACARGGLDNHQVAARTHVHMGVVLFAGFKQKDEAIEEFKKALQIQPDITLDKLLATPEIQEVFDQAGSGAKGGETAPPAADAITHEPITRSTQGKPIPINMTLDSSVKAKRVVLSFRADGTDDFGEREMNEDSPGNWMGEIPASATQGGKLDYFIAVHGDDDQVLASKGSSASPLPVTLVGPGGTRLVKKAPPPPPPEEKEEKKEGPTWFAALGIGSGFGWTTGAGEGNGYQISPPGFAWSRLGQVSPELGYFVSPQLVLSLQLRLQLVTGGTTTPAGTGACGSSADCAAKGVALSGFARARWLFDFDDLHPFVGGLLGGGDIRHVASFASKPLCGASGNDTCVDTVASGPIFVGGSGGLLYNVSPSVALLAETNLAFGFTHFTFNVDIDVGVAFEF